MEYMEMLDRFSSRSKEKSAESIPTPSIYKKERQKVVVRMKSGDVYYGSTFALNRQAEIFHLELVTAEGISLNKTLPIAFKNVKALFYVKSFDGRFDPAIEFPQDIPPAKALAVEFSDGEVIVGRPMHARWNEEVRFFLVPEDQKSNNLMVLVERSAVVSIQDADLYTREQENAYQKYKATHFKPEMSDLECQGDYLFRSGKYGDAFRIYRDLFKNDQENSRLKKKVCAARYNLGIRFIRQRNYTKALQFMEAVLALDPSHQQAQSRVEQLRTHIQKKQSQSSRSE